MPDFPDAREFKISPAIAVLTSFAFGIAFDRFCDIHWQVSLLGAVSTMGFWLLCFAKRKEVFAIVGLALATFFAGSFWHHGRWNWFAKNDLSSYCENQLSPVCIRATILGEAKLSVADEESPFHAMPTSTKTKFRIRPTAIRNGTQWEPLGGQARLVVYGDLSKVNFGDQVQVFGRLALIPKPTSPGNFDLRHFYRARNMSCAVYSFHEDAVVIEQKVSRFSQASVLSWLRTRLNGMIWRHVDASQAGFASAILLGNREQLSRTRQQAFLSTGTAHLLAISGLHVGILAGFFLMAYQVGLVRRLSLIHI